MTDLLKWDCGHLRPYIQRRLRNEDIRELARGLGVPFEMAFTHSALIGMDWLDLTPRDRADHLVFDRVGQPHVDLDLAPLPNEPACDMSDLLTWAGEVREPAERTLMMALCLGVDAFEHALSVLPRAGRTSDVRVEIALLRLGEALSESGAIESSYDAGFSATAEDRYAELTRLLDSQARSFFGMRELLPPYLTPASTAPLVSSAGAALLGVDLVGLDEEVDDLAAVLARVETLLLGADRSQR